MKKLIASLAVAFLMAAGLVAGTSVTATAGPYSGSVSTIVQSSASNPRTNQNLRVRIGVRAAQGNGTPRGPVQVTIARKSNGKAVRVFKRYYDGSPNTYKFRTKGLKPGRYIVIVTYIGRSNSVYRGSATAGDFVVRR
jgi:hypothetical protein